MSDTSEHIHKENFYKVFTLYTNRLVDILKPPLCESLVGLVLFYSNAMQNTVVFFNDTSYWMTQGMVVASFTCDSIYLVDTWFLSCPNKNYKVKNLITK